jgi:nickel-dependent lactate racemase
VGSALFEEWMRRAASIDELANTPEETIVLGGHRAVATARVMQGCEIVVVSDLPHETVEGMLFTYAASLDEALAYAQAKHGDRFRAYVMPHGGFILPTVVET